MEIRTQMNGMKSSVSHSLFSADTQVEVQA
jgi:hypothetical protein